MATVEDVEGYLIRMDQPFEELDDGLWVIHDEYDHIDNIVISYADPLVLFRVKLMELPAGRQHGAVPPAAGIQHHGFAAWGVWSRREQHRRHGYARSREHGLQ